MTSDGQDLMRSAVAIDPLRLQDEFVALPAQLAYWGERVADATRRHLLGKLQREQAYAEAYLRVSADQAGKKRGEGLTVDGIKAAVELDPSYLDAKHEEIEADAERVRVRGIADAMHSKREMLISLGAHVRAEMQHDPIIREEQRSRAPGARG